MTPPIPTIIRLFSPLKSLKERVLAECLEMLLEYRTGKKGGNIIVGKNVQKKSAAIKTQSHKTRASR